jgi:RNase adaptor protein for sRNA GlmZ degradation
MGDQPAKSCEFISFGYKYGPPKNVPSEFCFSVKNFPSPSKSVRDKYDGTHQRLQNELYHNTKFEELYQELLGKILNIYRDNINSGSDIKIAIGCEEGVHRSVAIIEKLATEDLIWSPTVITMNHRDLGRRQKQIAKDQQYNQRRKEKRGYDDAYDD